jgi:hypothetical protein
MTADELREITAAGPAVVMASREDMLALLDDRDRLQRALATLREDIAAEIEDQMMDGHTRGACVASWQEAITHCAAVVRAMETKP